MDPILDKAIDFTLIEDKALAVWLEAALVGEFGHAARIIDRGLLAEHYRSLLPNFLTDATEDERETLARLRQQFEQAIADFRARPRRQPAPREPGSPREG